MVKSSSIGCPGLGWLADDYARGVKKIRTEKISKKVIIWIILTEAILILSTRLGAFLHEFVGHGMMAEFFGGHFGSFSLSLFAGGSTQFSGHFSETGYLFISFGGIVINIVTGCLVLRYLRTHKPSFSLTLFGLFLAGVSILSQLQYLILGAYYQYGDPLCLLNYPKIRFLAWSAGLIILAISSWYCCRLFFKFQNAYFPYPDLFHRAAISLLILGVPVLLYAGLYQYFKTPLGSTVAILDSELRLQKEAEQIKANTRSSQSLEDIKNKLRPHPLLPWIVIIYFLTSLVAFLYPGQPGTSLPAMSLSFFHAFTWLLASSGVLALIAFLW